MSFTFSVRSPAPPDYRKVLAEIDREDVRPDPCEDHHPEDGRWPDSQVHHFYRHGVSTRGCEIEYANNEFSVRINTLASPEDYDLGMRFIEVVAEFAGKKIHTEDDLVISRRDLRDKYDAAWIRKTNMAGLKVVTQMIQDEIEHYNSIQIGGVFRPFHLGSRTLGELEQAGESERLLERFMDQFQFVQYADSNDRYYAAQIMSIKKNEEDEEIQIAVYAPDVDYLLPDVPFLIVIGLSEKELLRVPITALPNLAPGRWRWLDERQTLVEKTPEAEWPNVVTAARKFAVD